MADAANEFNSPGDGRTNASDQSALLQPESFLSNRISLTTASMDFTGANRAFGDRNANLSSSLPGLTLTKNLPSPETVLGAMNLSSPIPILQRNQEATNIWAPEYKAPTLQELSNRRNLSSMGDMPLDRLSRGALDYIKTNQEQLRRSPAMALYEARNSAQQYLPNVTINNPSFSSYNYDMPRNWQQQHQFNQQQQFNQFNQMSPGCQCPNCANGSYRPDNGMRPYQAQPWSQPQPWNQSQQYDQWTPGYVPPNAPAGYGDPQFNDPRYYNQAQPPNQRFDALVPRPGEFRPASNRVTPDLMPPGWFDELYGSPDQAPPRQPYNDGPMPPQNYPPRRPPNRVPETFDPSNLPPPRPDLVQPGERDIRMISEPSISAEKIDEILRYYKSPAVGVGKELYALGVKYGIDPAIALGFFIVESTAGKHGRAARNNSWGNIKGTGPAGTDGTFRKYNTFAEGAEDWFKLIKYQYVATEPNEFYRRKPFGAQTLREVIRRYAPGSDGNNEGGYIGTVISLRQKWAREMLAQQPSSQRYAENDR